MSDKSAIEWTDATWNPIVGCSILSPGCTNCYAMKMAARIERMHEGRTHYAGTTQSSKAGAVWTGKVALAPDHILTQPLRWKRGRRIFVNSMGDLFHESIPDEWIDRVFAVMALCPQHTFQVLTKRAQRMRDYFAADPRDRVCEAIKTMGLWGTVKPTAYPFPNVWLGVSTERQQEADERIPLLLQTPTAVRFISAEPLIGPIDLAQWHGPLGSPFVDTKVGHPLVDAGAMTLIEGLDWVIVGGESGQNARPMHPQWAHDLHDQCAKAGVKFFFKQWGMWAPVWCAAGGSFEYSKELIVLSPGGNRAPYAMIENCEFPNSAHVMERTGKKAAGRLLDGREHNEIPEART